MLAESAKSALFRLLGGNSPLQEELRFGRPEPFATLGSWPQPSNCSQTWMMKAPTCNSGCAYPTAILVTGATCSSWALAATKSQLRKILAESASPSCLVAKPFAPATSNLVCVGRVSQICLIPTAWWPQPFGKCCCWAAGAICNARFLASAKQLQPNMKDESTNLQQWLRLPNCNPGDRSHLQQMGVGRNQVPA